MIQTVAFLLLIFTSISSRSENTATLQKIHRLENENVNIFPFIENRLTVSSDYQTTNTYLVSKKPLLRKINHKMSPTLTSILEMPLNLHKKIPSIRENKFPSKHKKDSSQNSKLTTSPTPFQIEFYSNNQLSTESDREKWSSSTRSINKNSSNQIVFKEASTSIEGLSGDQFTSIPPSADTKKLEVIERPEFNLEDKTNKSFVSNGSVLHQDESISQRERKIIFLEEKLKSQGENENSSLLFAISLLHKHINTTSTTDTDLFLKSTPHPSHFKNISEEKRMEYSKVNKAILSHQNRTKIATKYFPLINSRNESPSRKHPSPRKNLYVPLYRSFILLLDGDCMHIRNRMSTFVKYLKGTLAAKLGTDYSDIRVPSVVCDQSFVVNISFDENKYPEAYSHLRGLAASNATLLEISGHIFYLEKVLTTLPSKQFKLKDYFGGDYELHVIAFVSAICLCVFIGIAVATAYLLKCHYCRSATQMLRKEEDILNDEKAPNIIYSENFTKLLKSRTSCNPSDGISESSEINIESKSQLSSGLYPFSFSNDNFDSIKSFNEKNQIFCKSSSQLRLMEEIQEDEDYLGDELRLQGKTEC